MTVTNIFCILLKSTKQIIIISSFENNWFIKIRTVFGGFVCTTKNPNWKSELITKIDVIVSWLIRFKAFFSVDCKAQFPFCLHFFVFRETFNLNSAFGYLLWGWLGSNTIYIYSKSSFQSFLSFLLFLFHFSVLSHFFETNDNYFLLFVIMKWMKVLSTLVVISVSTPLFMSVILPIGMYHNEYFCGENGYGKFCNSVQKQSLPIYRNYLLLRSTLLCGHISSIETSWIGFKIANLLALRWIDSRSSNHSRIQCSR